MKQPRRIQLRKGPNPKIIILLTAPLSVVLMYQACGSMTATTRIAQSSLSSDTTSTATGDCATGAACATVAPGTSDDAAAIQASIDAIHAKGGGTVNVLPGVYVLKRTLRLYPHMTLAGGGFGRTIFNRTGNYGNTVEVGSNDRGAGAQDVEISGIWFNHLHTYVAGSTVTLDNPVSSGVAHIAIRGGQDVRIHDNWITNLGFGIYLDGGTKITIENNNISGIYDPALAGLQEGFASIGLFRNSAHGDLATIVNINGNYINGSFSTNRAVDWGAGAPVTNTHSNTGSLYGIYIECLESGTITNNYIGGNSGSGVYFNTVYIVAGVSVANNYFDGATLSQITFNYNGSYAQDVTISGNNFFAAQVNGFGILSKYNGTNPSVSNLVVTGNTFRDQVKAAIELVGTIGFNISSNTFQNYNADGLSFTNPEFAAGIFLVGGAFGVTRNGVVANNVFGGGPLYATSADPGNFAVWGVYGNGASQVSTSGNSGSLRTGGTVIGGDL